MSHLLTVPQRETQDDDRLFVKNGWRHYRRTYSLAEARWGFLVLAVMLATLTWVIWMGKNGDPSLFAAVTPPADPAQGVDRGPLPSELAGEGWVEGKVSHFGSDNLYVKINGRADYFLAFGFTKLFFVTLSHDSETVIDIELYDLGKAENALGAFSGEKEEAVATTIDDSGMSQLARNALLLTSGRYYVRAIGSVESEVVKTQLLHVKERFAKAGDAQALPWAFELFTAIGFATDKVSYVPENAFSFGFASDVWAVADGDMELFVVALATAGDAEAMATQFVEGFASYGEDAPSVVGARWIQDRYISTLATAVAVDRWVIGVRAAPDKEVARAALTRLKNGMAELSADTKARAQPSDKKQEPAEPGSPGGKEIAPHPEDGYEQE